MKMTDLVSVMNDSRKTIYPNYLQKRELCTFLTFANLAEPDWIQINCSAKLLTQMICIKREMDYLPSNKVKQKYLKSNKLNRTVGQESHNSFCVFSTYPSMGNAIGFNGMRQIQA